MFLQELPMLIIKQDNRLNYSREATFSSSPWLLIPTGSNCLSISRSVGVTVDIILRGSTSCRRLFLFLWIVAEIASQNIIEAWKRKFQVLPAYIIANSGE